MLFFWITMLVFWILVIAFPNILVWLIWGFFIFMWINLIIFNVILNKNKWKKDSYVKVGEYKIYR